MSRIVELALYASDPEASETFLKRALPDLAGPTPRSRCRISYLQATSPATPRPQPFWKYTVFCDDIDIVRHRIVQAGVDVSPPVQFLDIGYLCHFNDPGGVEIELLQRTFQHSSALPAPQPDQLGLITLRITDKPAARHFYEDALGMKPLAEMAIADGRPDPFDLSFYAFTQDSPPDQDLSSVANREWLYQRDYPMIELQHHRSGSMAAREEHGAPGGLAHVVLEMEKPSDPSGPAGHHYRFVPRS